MKTFTDYSITHKLIALMLLAALTSLFIATTVQAISTSYSYRNNIAQSLVSMADVIATNSAAAVAFEDKIQADRVVGSFIAEPSVVVAHIYSLDAGLLGTYNSPRSFSKIESTVSDATAAEVAASITAGQSLVSRNGFRSIDIVRPVLLDGEVIGVVHMRATLASVISMLRRFSLVALAIVAIVVLVVYRLSSKLQTLISRPILNLADVMGRVTRDSDYSLRATKSGNDEVGSLISDFNTMLAQIGERNQQLVQRNSKIDEQAKSLAKANKLLTSTMNDSIRAKDEAEAASMAKSQFLARMSHEIRTPMNGVLGMTELLLRQGLSGKKRHFAETIQNSAEALLNLINDILDFSKIEAGKLELDQTEFDLRDATEEIVELLSGHAQSKEIELLCDIAPDMPVRVHGDAMRLRQILTNLIGNAIKFTDKGEVIVRTRLEKQSGARGTFRFEVVDSGIGIHAENQAMIFELFSQEDSSTTRRYGGTGLGLAICKQLVELMGGEIGVDSEMGVGTTFWFSLQLELGNQATPKEGLERLEECMPLNVLVVDDNLTNREILEHQLDAWGITSHSVADAYQALDCLQQAAGSDMAFDLAILDWHMPEMNGLELAEQIRLDPKLHKLRLIMLSSASAENVASTMRKADIDAYANKPVRQSRLLECLVQALNADPGAGLNSKLSIYIEDTLALRIAGLTVLLVEDNPVNREVAISMLETMRCKVIVAVNGKQGVDLFEQGGVDLVLMDCEMPVMDGYAATNTIREIEDGFKDGRRVPIVALTAHALPEVRQRCFAVGMDDYLTKPFSFDQLRGCVDRCHEMRAIGVSWDAIASPVPQFNEAGMVAAAKAAAGHTEPGELHISNEWSADDTGEEQLIDPSELMLTDSINHALANEPADKSAKKLSRTVVRDGKVVCFETLESIVSLDAENGAGLLSRLIRMYEINSAELLQSIQTSFAAGDAVALSKAAHALKSSSGNVGAERLAELCKGIELAARNGDLISIGASIEMLLVEQGMVVEMLHDYQPGELA